MITKICLICGKKFYIYPSRIKKGEGKFCSTKCTGIAHKGKGNPRWKGGKTTKYCKLCGKKFLIHPSQFKWGYGLYCSQECLGKSRINNKNSNWKGGKIKRTCKVCKKEFYIIPARMKAKYGGGQYCSLRCVGIAHRGNKSPVWRGGLSTIQMKIRTSNKFCRWRQDIFIRDDFTCQKCGQLGGGLEVHHKKPFAKLLEEIKKYLPLFGLYDGAMLYTPLWELNNGITLCRKCHKKIHRRRSNVIK